jgi:hypothetical protein
MADDAQAGIPVALTATAGGPGALKIAVHVDAARLPYRRLDGRHVERLLFVTALFDEKNQFLTAVEGVMQLQLRDATVQSLAAHGLDARLSIHAPAGSYRLREVVQEIEDGRIASVSQPVRVY